LWHHLGIIQRGINYATGRNHTRGWRECCPRVKGTVTNSLICLWTIRLSKGGGGSPRSLSYPCEPLRLMSLILILFFLFQPLPPRNLCFVNDPSSINVMTGVIFSCISSRCCLHQFLPNKREQFHIDSLGRSKTFI
jgi:hypothetical protein